MAGLTSDAFVVKTALETTQSLKDALRGPQGISSELRFEAEDFFGSLVNILGEDSGDTWEALGALANALNPQNATGVQAVNQALLVGLTRGGPYKALALVRCNLNAGFIAAANEMKLELDTNTAVRFQNRYGIQVIITGIYDVLFECEVTGPFFAPQGHLVIADGGIAGWNSANLLNDGIPGGDVESIESLKARREQAVATGTGTGPSTVSALMRLPGMVSAGMPANRHPFETDSRGIPPRTVAPVIWDASVKATSNEAIAQTILDHLGGSATLYGSTVVAAKDFNGEDQLVAFTRALERKVYVSITVYAPNGVNILEVQNAITTSTPGKVGGGVMSTGSVGTAAFQVPGVRGVSKILISTVHPIPTIGDNEDIDILWNQYATIAPSDVHVTAKTTL